MNFPLGPYRNLGDLRLWAVASIVWAVAAGAYAFYLHPATSQWVDAPDDVVFACFMRPQFTDAEMQVISNAEIAKRDAEARGQPPPAPPVYSPALAQKNHTYRLCVADAQLDWAPQEGWCASCA